MIGNLGMIRLTLLALAAALATPAMAAEKGMPQLDPSTFMPQLVWLAIIFTCLYLIVSRVALPRIGGMIEERRSRIESDLDRAQELKDDTEKVIASYEAALAEARGKAHAIMQERRAALGAEIDAERARLDEELALRVAKAEKAIGVARDKALSQVAGIASGIAGDIVAQLTGIKVAKAEAAKAVARLTGK
jgi:F-type H+-transporting ATPase subunit b